MSQAPSLRTEHIQREGNKYEAEDYSEDIKWPNIMKQIVKDISVLQKIMDEERMRCGVKLSRIISIVVDVIGTTSMARYESRWLKLESRNLDEMVQSVNNSNYTELIFYHRSLLTVVEKQIAKALIIRCQWINNYIIILNNKKKDLDRIYNELSGFMKVELNRENAQVSSSVLGNNHYNIQSSNNICFVLKRSSVIQLAQLYKEFYKEVDKLEKIFS